MYQFKKKNFLTIFNGHFQGNSQPYKDNKDKERVGTWCKNESFKFVGVPLDENLNWNHHLKLVKNKATRVQN